MAGVGVAALFESIREYAIFMTDPNGVVMMWNPGAERAYGYPATEAVGLPMARFHSADEVASGAPTERLVRATATGAHQTEGWRVRKDGTRFWAAGSNGSTGGVAYVQLGSTVHDLLALLGGDAVGDLGSVLAVVHQQHIEVLERSKGERMKGGAVRMW